MKLRLAVAVGIMALVLAPAIVSAKSGKGGGGKSGDDVFTGASPNASAYEHADEKARFQRDSHDMGQNREHEKNHEDEMKDKDSSALSTWVTISMQ